jgi:hypothetical protein
LAFSGLWSIRLITLLYLHCHPSIFLLVISPYCYHSRKASTSFIDIWTELSTCQKFHSFINVHAPVARWQVAPVDDMSSGNDLQICDDAV